MNYVKLAKLGAYMVAIALMVLLMQTYAHADGDATATDFDIPFDGETLAHIAVAIFLAAVAEFMVGGLVEPFFERYGIDYFWLKYVAWLVASAIVAASGINLFQGYIPNDVIGMILTAIFCGGGSNKIHDFFDTYLSKKKGE